jgi:GntP family gluconate:H+ symporter
MGLCSGMPLGAVLRAFQDGVGAMLGSIAVVVGLGMIIGKLLSESGAAQVIAQRLIDLFGPNRIRWTLMVVGFVIGLPVFFTVGVVLLIPIVASVANEAKRPLLYCGIPVMAGLSVAHGLVPPHPGPMAAIGLLQADPGRTVLYAILIGLPTAVIAGPVLGRFLDRAAPGATPRISPPGNSQPGPGPAPGFGLGLLTIVAPVLLMLGASAADVVLAPGQPLRAGLDFLGSPVVALLSSTLLALYTFGVRCGLNRTTLLRCVDDCLGPAGAILLVVGAGGGFNRVLVASGVGDALAKVMLSCHLSPLFLGWTLAAMVRVATGSATVAITTAAGLIAPSLAGGQVSRELLVIAMGAGSLILSHVNDGGFWFVKEYFGLTVPETLRSWTILETLIAVIALAFALLLNALL